MNQLIIKWNSYKVKFLIELKYLNYKLREVLGLKTIGYNKYNTLVLFKLLKKYELPFYSMHVVTTNQDLRTANLEEIHDYGLRLEKEEYLSIITNMQDEQVRIVVGENMSSLINDFQKSEIENLVQKRVSDGEILAGLEEGMKQVYFYISD
ncbi:hypothetical protein D1818_09885 [Aquimarina sp. BL5]|uniref:TPM domain-containing protein n=1 Tax=Aquimarina sp. BL5 TaxID=1714860 RepID=UPI000E476D99|nr:TPM domain-containing protein [Aquimarina sp. BL5]AXT51121.1 hypothetical protein D1818_09885 [Aquimarina sp. BL5]RKN06021.1 hypothetical protein D7036_09505 [Aquimarina sp. BL5]